jgi:hypothetical protein
MWRRFRATVVRDTPRFACRPLSECRHWVKIKNPAHPAYSGVRDLHQLRSRGSA